MYERYLEMTGKTEDEAIAAALGELNLERDDVSVEILERSKSGFWGLGSTPAKVRITYQSDEPLEPEAEPVADPISTSEPATPPAAPVKTEEVAPPAESAAKKNIERPRRERPERRERVRVPATDEQVEKAREFLNGLLSRMEIEASIDIAKTEDGMTIEISGPNMGLVIGRRGDVLDNIQQLTSHVVNAGCRERARVIIDTEGYRARRADTLTQLALRTADKVVRFRRNMTLDPMNAYERHVVHTALQEVADIRTFSVGNDPNRKVCIAYDGGEE